MLGVGECAHGSFDVLPATLIVERAPNRGSDEHAALTPAHPAVESTNYLVVQTYVQTHGHSIAHTHQGHGGRNDGDLVPYAGLERHRSGGIH
jgi:hypothetical protein